MTKIAELINIHSGYAKYVNLVQEFTDPTQNRGRMEQYMPIKSHREAFRALSHALYPMDNRVYLLTGSYGTGKSHLCLMLANYLAYKTSETELEVFFENWAKRDRDEAEKLRNLRGDGIHLVAICEYGTGDDFDSMVLRAIGAAVEREQIGEVWLDTHYQEAVRRIKQWEKRQQQGKPSGAFLDFQDALTERYSGWTLESLKEDLLDFSQEALNIFRELYRFVVGSDFTYSKDNLVDILQDFLSNPRFKERYKGLAIIADEFGYILDRANIRIDVFQRFAEMCHQGVGGSQLMFVGTGHKSFRAYAAGKLSAADFSVVADRVEEIPLQSEELELIISAIVDQEKSHPAWQKEVAKESGTFNRFAMQASRLGLFKHLKMPEIRERVVEDIYPMHPMATHCLIELSTEVGSDARSVFAFFSGALETEPVPGSYRHYIDSHDVTDGDHLNLYTADRLYTYFEAELQPETTEAREAVRQHIRNFQASMRQVRKEAKRELVQEVDPLVQRILKLLLIYEIGKVAPTFENLAFGLYMESPAQKSKLESRLEMLVNQQALFRSATGIYEFRSSHDMNFEELLEHFLSDPENAPKDLAEEVTELVSLGRGGQWLEAKNHNQPYDEDKRLLRVFVEPSALEGKYLDKSSGDQVDYFAHLEQRRLSMTDWNDRYEGTAVYVLCETDEDIARARRASEQNESDHVVLGIPRQPIPIREAVMNLRAALHIRETQELDAMSIQDRTRLQEDVIGDERRETGFMGDFVRARRRYLAAQELDWYSKGGSVLVAQPQSEYEPADELMGRLYEKRNSVPHPYLNQIHLTKNRFGVGKDVPLNDAVDALLRTHRPVEVDHSLPANRGEIRYLKNVLADTGALKQMGPFKGNIAEYKVEPAVDKYRQKLPALAAMIEQVRALEQGKTLMVRELIERQVTEPFGQGPIALSLFLAYTVRTFGDELRLQLQPGQVGYAELNDPDRIIRLVDGDHPNAVLERQAISEAERSLIGGIHNLFAIEPGAAGDTHTVREAYDALQRWWDALPNLAKAPDVYEEDSTAKALVNLLRDIANANAYRLILGQIQTVYGLSEDQVVTDAHQAEILSGLASDKQTIEQIPEQIKDRLLKQIMDLEFFAPEGDHASDYQQAVQAWYADLGEEQKDIYASWHSNPSKAALSVLAKLVNINETFFSQLPANAGFGLGRVDDWRRDRTDEYVQMLHDALHHIEENRVKVPPPKWKIRGVCKKEERDGFARISFRGGVTLEVNPPQDDVVVLLTDNNEDPREADQREQISETYELSVKRSPMIKLVSQAPDGSYGRVIELSFVNEDSKYEITPLSKKIFDSEYKFVFPKDDQALKVLLQSVLKDVMEQDVVDRERVRQILKELADTLGSLY